MSEVPVTVLAIQAVAMTESLLNQMTILKERRRGVLEYDSLTNRVRLDLYEGVLELEVFGYVWRPDIVGHRACYWVIVGMGDGGLARVHVFSPHSRPADPPPELRGMKQIFVVGDGDKEAGG